MRFNQFELCCFSSPYVTDKDFKDYADCGFSAVFLDWNEGGIGSAKFEESLNYCDKYNIKALPMLIDKKAPDEKVAKLKRHKSFVGFHVCDEPHGAEVDECKKLLLALKKDYGEITYFCNLAPNYYDATIFDSDRAWEGVKYYVVNSSKEFIADNKGRKILSTDFYPILKKNGEKWLAREWLKHLEVFSSVAKEKKYELFFYIMSTGGWHDNIPYEKLGLFAGEVTGIDCLRMQGFIDMAYGVTSLGFFTYKDQVSFDYTALVGRKGKHRLYYSAKKAIEEFKFLAMKLDGYDWICANTYLSDNPSPYAKEAFDMLSENRNTFSKILINNNSLDLVVGEFYNKTKKKFGYVLSSYIYPNGKARNSLSFSVVGDGNALITDVVRKTTKEIEKKDNKIFLLGNDALFIEIDE